MSQHQMLRVLIKDKVIPIKFKQIEWWNLFESRPETFFVPDVVQEHATAKCLLRGFLFEEVTHMLVRHICDRIPGKDVVHAGAFVGDMLPSFSKANPEGKIFAFEPVHENYYACLLTTNQNKLSNVVLHHAALSNEVGTFWVDSQMVMHTEDVLGSLVDGKNIAAGGQLTNAHTVDMYNMANIVCMHIDVEGHEQKVLEGAEGTLQKYKPIVMLEDYGVTEAIEFMEKQNYHRIGDIPKISVWVPKDMPQYIEVLTEFFKTERMQREATFFEME